MPLKLGLFGGSFDPPHKAHLALARAALRELNLNRLFLVPAARSPHKKGQAPVSARHRLAMARALAHGRKRMVVSPWEIQKGGVSYTYQTLRAFRRRYPKAQWFILMGGDALASFKHWRRWREILSNAGLVVGRRPGVKGSSSLNPQSVSYLKAPMPDISSTRLRRALREGKSVFRWVPQRVAGYIAREKLYSHD